MTDQTPSSATAPTTGSAPAATTTSATVTGPTETTDTTDTTAPTTATSAPSATGPASTPPTTAPSPVRPLTRRALLTGLGAGAGLVAAAGTAQALGLPLGSLAGSSVGSSRGPAAGLLPDRPSVTHGVASGDVSADGALIWARADRPARMIVETSADPSFSRTRVFRGRDVLGPGSDGTGRLRVAGLRPGRDRDVHYRVILEDAETGLRSDPVTGVFRTAPTTPSTVRIHWSGDVAGQGFGINPDVGGMFCWSTMADRSPDLFIHSGDTVYADGPIGDSTTLPDGRVWRNVTTEAKSAVAQTLDQFRGQHAYNLLDDNYRRFNSRVAQVVQWDDHETVNNWYPGEVLDNPAYTVRDVDTLAARGFQAFHEWQPLDRRRAVDGRVYRRIAYGPLVDVFVLDMRSYKDANPLTSPTATAPGHILGDAQTEWLIREVNYSPDRAAFQDFSPFWEFVSGPLNAGGFGPNDMDPTFGPEVVYVHAPGKDHANSSPLDDFQHFGEIEVDGDSRELTVRLFTTRGTELWGTTLRPR
ncbi:alkaline phosphatase D family protein [Corynebacterium bovis]|uniref:alkaline phosphatase D family protein n=1 Tax=Corynebacterium bovis TaxID=36808 RepID=UPI000F652FA9|nr:alkaline phosphatase D family protein [Corynebacterium bovis]RRQ14416.1 alkaline phosphatase [Corynebacterium bovis]